MKRVLNIFLAIALGVSSIFGVTRTVYAEENAGENIEEIQKVVVALDPGHDAKHAGATAAGLLEHELTLKIANYCKEELEKYENIEVYMTRTSAECPYPYTDRSGRCIAERMLAAQNAGASFYVSFHLNAQDGGTAANGAEVIHPNANWKPDVGAKGKALAQMIQNELVSLGLTDRGIYSLNSSIGERYPDGSASDYYTVQISGKECGIPGVIVENAFLSNASDRNNFLTTEEGLKKLGVANANAIAKMVGAKIGWVYENNAWYYYVNEVAQTGWLLENGTWYFMNDEGVMQTGWILDGGTWYYLHGSGTMATGWNYINGTWYYMNNNGVMLTGWQYIGGHWYYMNESGAMQVGWLLDGNHKYFLDSSGAMSTGWRIVDNAWYYMNASGVMLTGWQCVGGQWYYLDENGAMQVGWMLDGEVWYYLHGNGIMSTGWLKINNAWYYMNPSGAMLTGWQYVGDEWYYMMETGRMVSGEYEIEGQKYYFNADGSWIK